MKKIVFVFLFTVIPMMSFAWDLIVDGIYYSVNPLDKTAKVVPPLNGRYNKENITIPESVTYEGSLFTVVSIDDCSFQDCDQLQTISLPKTLRYIGINAFYRCNSLRSLLLPDSLEIIDCSAFCQCYGIESLEIPNSVTSIGDDAFYECSIKTLKIGKGLEKIGYQPFYRCMSLSSIVVDEENPFYDSRDNCNAIIATESDSLIVGSINTIIPEGIKTIGIGAFAYLTELKDLFIPNSVEIISENAFCEVGFTSINFPPNLKKIGNSAFFGCQALTSVSMPESVKYIGGGAFSDCHSLESVNFPNSVEYLGHMAFSSTTWEANLPEGLSYIGRFAYLFKLDIFKQVPDSIHIDIKKGTIGFSGYTFRELYGSKVTFSLPDELRYVGCSTFAGLNLGSIVLPNDLEIIGDHAFQHCSLHDIVLGAGVSKIGSYAFTMNDELSNFYCYAKEPPVFIYLEGNYESMSNPFDEGAYSATLHVPAESIEKYKSAYGWGNFANIVAIEESDPKPTMINNVILDKQNKKDWYDLNGRKLNSEPSKKGVYINNGKKVVKN